MTFVRNDAEAIMAGDFFVVVTATFRLQSSLLRHADDVVVVPDAAFIESFDGVGHRAQQRLKPHAVAADPAVGAGVDRANEGAGSIERECLDVTIKAPPLARVLKEVLLDVGKIEGGNSRILFLQIRSDGSNRFRPCEVADEGHEKILRLQFFEEGEVIFGCKIAACLALSVICSHEVRISRAAESAKSAESSLLAVMVFSVFSVSLWLTQSNKLLD